MPLLNHSLSFLNLMRGLGITLILTMGAAHAEDLKPLAREAMVLSGAQAMLEGTGPMLEKQYADDPRMAKLGKNERAKLLAILKSVIDGRRMADDLTTTLAGTHDRDRLTVAVATMRDPQFRKTTQAIVAETLLATDQNVIAYAKTFEKTPPDPARVKLLQQLDTATDGSRILADIRYESVEAMMGQHATAEDRAQLPELRKQIDMAAQNEFLVRNLYVVRKLDNATLEAYVGAHENEPMGWLARQMGYGIQRAIVKAVGELGQKLAAFAPAEAPKEAPKETPKEIQK